MVVCAQPSVGIGDLVTLATGDWHSMKCLFWVLCSVMTVVQYYVCTHWIEQLRVGRLEGSLRLTFVPEGQLAASAITEVAVWCYHSLCLKCCLLSTYSG